MFTTIEGMYRDGKIELSEMPCDMCEGTPVLVTFLPSDSADLQTHGIDRAQATDLRQRLATFAEDWESPEMCIYDDMFRSSKKESQQDRDLPPNPLPARKGEL